MTDRSVDFAALPDVAQARLPQMLTDLERVITLETPSEDHAAVAAGARDLAALIEERVGTAPEVLEIDGVTHLRLRFGSGPVKVVLLNHQDTVWPHGTLERLPFSVADGILRGPGSFDMLTGTIMSIHATAMLLEQAGDSSALDGLTILITGDEELGSTTSSQLIRDEAAGARAVYVMEASAAGSLKLARKGTSDYEVTVHGKAAHAGLEPEKGVNAGLELARLMPLIAEMADDEKGTTVVPTTITAGTTPNTVPAKATVHVDVRARLTSEQERIDSEMRAVKAEMPGAEVEVTGGINRPPFERDAAAHLFDRAVALAGEIGIAEPTGTAVGGASDGNFTAGDGIPTLDGLGAVGDGAHAEHEHAIISEIPPRTALLAALIADQLAD